MSEIGEKIRALREARGLSRRAFGAQTGVPEAKVQAVEIGKQRADHEFLANIVRRLDVDANWLLSDRGGFAEGDGSDGGFAAGGSGPGWVEIDQSDGARERWLGIGTAFLAEHGVSESDLLIVPVAGKSMEPRLSDGDRVLVNCAARDLKDGQTFVVRFGDDLIVKQVQMLPQAHVQLVSANPEFPPILVDLSDTDMTVIGQVIAALHVF